MKKLFTLRKKKKKYHPLSIFLIPFTIIYYFLTALNKLRSNSEYCSGLKVICVGNLYVGGTGKTPLVKKIYDDLSKKQKCCIIKKFRSSHIDEINFLGTSLDLITPQKRVQGLKYAEVKGYSTAILDDGMQDYSFKKDISILCIKSKNKFGNKRILPAGPLRETLKNIKNYNIAVINGETNKKLEKLIFKYNQSIKIFYSNYQIKNLEKLVGKKFLAFSGIADNKSFFEILKRNNIEFLDTEEFNDHHNFSKNEIENLIIKSKSKNIQLITTEKNYNNIHPKYKNKIYYTELDLVIDQYNQFLNEIN